MILSVHNRYEDIETLLESRGCPLIEGVRKYDLKILIDFLQPFNDSYDSLEMEAAPTIQLFVLQYHKLKKHVSTPESNVELRMIK